MKLTKKLILILLIFIPVLTSSTPLPDSSRELISRDLADLARVNQRSFQVTLPVYKFSEDGRRGELLNETTSARRLVCQTSAGSPYVRDIERAASSLSGSDDWCEQRNLGGSGCTTYSRDGTAALGVCGAWGLGMRCDELAWIGNLVAEKCRWKDQAGGQYYYYDNSFFGWLKGIVY